MGIDRGWTGGHFPLLFEVEGTPVFCLPTFSGVDIFCTNAHGIRWMIGAIFVQYSQLILMIIIKIVATRCQILTLKCSKQISTGASPQTLLGSLQRCPDP